MAYRVAYLRPPGTAASPSIGLITLETKCAGARSAGNPHAACDVAGAGNGATAIPKRARRWKRRTQPRSCLRVTAPALDPTTPAASLHYASRSRMYSTRSSRPPAAASTVRCYWIWNRRRILGNEPQDSWPPKELDFED